MMPNGLSPVELLLQQVGEINGKIDGILQGVEDIKDDNLRCHADRDDLHKDIGRLRSRQSWIVGVGTGIVTLLTFVGSLLHFRTP